MIRGVVLLCLLGACASSADRVELASVSFEAPARWQRSLSTVAGTASAVLTPTDNVRKESVTIIRSEIGELAPHYSAATLAQLLAGSQSALPMARATAISRVQTDSGLQGVQLSVDYVPPGLARPYHRVHAVLADGTALVHVMYTALVPDPELAAFKQVLSTLREDS